MEIYQKLAHEILRELCPIPAPSHYEDKRVEYCVKKLGSLGIQDVQVDEAKNVIWELKGKDPRKTVIFAAHTDVVFPDTEPLPFREDEENIYCPGCGDDTACVAQLMSIMKKVADEKKTPAVNVVFALNACEEGLGNLKGTRALMQRYGGSTQAFFTFDGGYRAVTDKSVGSHRYSVTVKTKGGHSFGAFGNENAARVLAQGIQEIYQIQVPQNGGKTTYNVGIISGGTSVNTIIQQASMLCEYRSDVYENLEYMKEQFYAIFDRMAQFGQVEVELVGERPSMKGVDPQKQQELTDFCAAVQKKHAALEDVPIKSGSTDCNIPHSMGIPAVCVGTYAGGGTHTREEWIEKNSVTIGVGIVAEIVEKYFTDGV